MKDFNNQIKSAGRRAGSRSAESAGRGSLSMGTLEGFDEERKPRRRRSFASEDGDEERRTRTTRTRRSFGSEEGREERATRVTGAPRTRRNFGSDERGEEIKNRKSGARRAFSSDKRGDGRTRAPRARRAFGSDEREERRTRTPRTRRSFGLEEGREERTTRVTGAPRTRRNFGSDERGEERKNRKSGTRRAFEQEEMKFTPKTRTPRTTSASRGDGSKVSRAASSSRGAASRVSRATSASRVSKATSASRVSKATSASKVSKATSVSKASNAKKADDGLVRLNKFIANSGVCSRREADEYITAGLVTVNGETVAELGTKVSYSDDIRFNGERLRGEEKVYIVMNKPKDFVTTVSDPHAENTVVQLVANKCKERVYPVGRLDKSTTGVLLLTNDGELAEQLTHPSYQKKKIYQVTLDKNLKGGDFTRLMEGITLEDGPIAADDLQYTGDDKSVVGIEIHSGRNRIVRRMFESLGYKVRKLDRVYFAGLTKKNLRRGAWRFLTEQEVAMLKMNSYN